MNTAIVFDFDEEAVRIVMIDGEPWFVAKDVCRVLEISNDRDAVGRLDADEKDDVGITDTIGRRQQTNIISESGLYVLIFSSRKLEAKRFRKWVTSEVLPALRKTGSYRVEDAGADAPEVMEEDDSLAAIGRGFGQPVDAAGWISLMREVRLAEGRAAASQVYRASPLPKPAEIIRLADYQTGDGTASPGAFLAERTERRQGVRIRSSDLYDAYARWAADTEYEAVSRNRFGKILNELNVPSVKSGGIMVRLGVWLKAVARVGGDGGFE